jgi:hypothetical protein
MGRHAGPAPGPSGPSLRELLGWGLFTLVLVVVALAWSGVPWLVVAGVGGTVLAGVGGVALAMALAPRRPPSDPVRRPAPGDDGDPRVP